MAEVVISKELEKEIATTFKAESVKIYEMIYSLKENPKKGKELANVGNIVVKELKYESFRFYFITDGFKIKFLKVEELTDLVLKFVRMSKKTDQQKTIEEIKNLLKKLGYGAF